MPSSSVSRVIQRTLTNQLRRQNQARSGVVKPARPAQVGGTGVVSIAGSPVSASGINAPARGQVAVTNVGRLANALYVPANASNVISTPGSIGGSSGTGGSYAAGDGITIAGSIISVNAAQIIDSASPFIVSSGNIAFLLRSPSGLVEDGTGLAVQPKANEGIGIDGSGTFVRRKTGGAIGVDANGIFVVPKANEGLATDASGIYIVTRPNFGLFNNAAGIGILKPAVSGLALDSTGLYVGEGDGIDVLSTTVAVNAGEITDTARGLSATSNNIGVNLSTNSGLRYPSGTLELGTPSSSSVSSSNAVTTNTHTHAVVTSTDVGTVPAAAILASTGGGALTLAQLTLRGNLIFAGADRSITASNNLTIAPTTDLKLNPAGLIILGDTGEPSGQELRTPTYNDFVAGISGLRHWDTGGNVRQLTIGKIKADELFVRVFTADEARVNRGEEFWTRSFGIVETAFTTPADEATVDVWFEEAPGLGNFKLFLPDNWILIRSIDWTTSLVVTATWYQVVDADGAGVNDYISRVAMVPGTDSRPSRQQWRLRRKSGGSTGVIIKPGTVAVDFGKPFSVTTPSPGQGIVHLSALAQDGGPFVQIQTFESVLSDVPQFKNRVRMGNLTGTVDYASDIFGFATGDDLSKTPSTGFRGITTDPTNGLRLFNTDIKLYEGSTLMATLNKDQGLLFDFDTADFATSNRYIRWVTDVASPGGAPTFYMGAYVSGTSPKATLRAQGGVGTAPEIALIADAQSTDVTRHYIRTSETITEIWGGLGGWFRLIRDATDGRGRALWAANPLTTMTPSSTFHIYENTTATGANAGLTIEQDGTGDAVLQFLFTGGQRWVTGIDKTDNRYKIAETTDLGTNTLLSIDPTSNVVYVNNALDVGTTINSGGAISAGGGFTTPSGLTVTRNGSSGGIRVEQQNDTAAAQLQAIYTGATDMRFLAYGPSAAGSRGGIPFASLGEFLVVSGSAFAITAIPNIPIYLLTNTTIRQTITGGGDFGFGTTSPASKMHMVENNSNTGANAGFTIQQSGTGDAVVQYLLTGGQRWVMGIDNSVAGDPFVISPAADLANGVLNIDTDGKFEFISTTASSNASLWTLRAETSQNSGITVYNPNNPGADIWFQFHTGTVSPRWWTFGMDRSEDDALVWAATNVMSGTSSPMMLTRGAALYVKERVYVGTESYTFGDSRLLVAAKSGDPWPLLLHSTLGEAGNAGFIAQYARGSTASPSAVLNNDTLLVMAGRGYAGATATYPISPPGVIRISATETHSNTARGTKILLEVTAPATTTRSPIAEFNGNGAVYFPTVYSGTTVAVVPNVSIASDGRLQRTTHANSSLRYKEEIRYLGRQELTSLVGRLRPVRYQLKGGDGRDFIGLIAEDVFDAGGREFIQFDQEGRPDALMYDRLIVALIAAHQQLESRVRGLEDQGRRYR